MFKRAVDNSCLLHGISNRMYRRQARPDYYFPMRDQNIVIQRWL
jgi:hypothetical protein